MTRMITDYQIRLLCSEAAAAGDLAQVALCRLALGEDPSDAELGTDLWMLGDRGVTQEQARATCVEVIAGTQILLSNEEVTDLADVLSPGKERFEASITRCTSCGEPTHASESDDHGRCEACAIQQR